MKSAYSILICTNKISALWDTTPLLHNSTLGHYSTTLLKDSRKLQTAQRRDESVIRGLENITVKEGKELGSVRLNKENSQGPNTLLVL